MPASLDILQHWTRLTERAATSPRRAQRIGEKIAALRQQMAFLRQMQEQVEASDEGQVSLTDPDARSMATSGRGTGIVGYNFQIAVDPEHHLVVAHDVVNAGHDRTQVVPMGGKAQQVIGAEAVTVLADRGYYNGDDVLACKGTGILPAMPRADTSGRANKRLFVWAPTSSTTLPPITTSVRPALC